MEREKQGKSGKDMKEENMKEEDIADIEDDINPSSTQDPSRNIHLSYLNTI